MSLVELGVVLGKVEIIERMVIYVNDLLVVFVGFCGDQFYVLLLEFVEIDSKDNL